MKIIELTEGTAIQVSGFTNEAGEFISVRKMYKRKGDTEWKYARDGISIPVAVGKKVRIAMKKQEETGKFPKLEKKG